MTRAFLTAEWRYLAMLNFRVDASVLAPLVPRGTRLDAWHGETWLSLVGFRFLRTRLMGVPVPGHRHFPEINLRFYVCPESHDRRAVVFIKEIVPRRAIAVVARAAYNEPYVTRTMAAEAPMVPEDAPGRVRYAWRHEGRWNRFGMTTVGVAAAVPEDSFEAFVAEHHWGYTRQRDRTTIEYEVEHPRWRVWPGRDVEFDVDVAAEYGSDLAAAMRPGPASAFVADGSAVRIGRPRSLLV